MGDRDTGSKLIRNKPPHKQFEESDVRIHSFVPEPIRIELDEDEEDCLLKVYRIADKELAHITKRQNPRDSDDELVIVRATMIVERIILEYLYKPLGIEQLPEHRNCWLDPSAANP